MTSSEFITLLAQTYNEPMIRDGQTNLKLKFIKKWVDDNFEENQLDFLAEKIIKTFILTSTNPCPLIPHIIEILDKDKPDIDSEAREAAARIVTALRCHSIDVGELGNEVVRLQGGWEALSHTVMEDDIPTHQAQWRDLAKSILIRRSKGFIEPPALPRTDNKPVLIGNIIKKLDMGNL